MQRKGIILAGGSGTRLYPATLGISKQMIPVYDKPMIYYALSTLMLAHIKDILIISSGRDLGLFSDLLGSGDNFGIKLSYKLQEKPEGIAQALIIAEEFLAGAPCALILGDNIFYGPDFPNKLSEANSQTKGATIFTYDVTNPERYGVVSFDKNNLITHIEEKPQNPQSKKAVTGLYFYDERVSQYAKSLVPSKRGELEITDINKIYLKNNSLHAVELCRGYAWLDMGTHESLNQASQFISAIENRQGIKISCLEEISWKNGWISDDKVKKMANKMQYSEYGKYLLDLLELNNVHYESN
ncbi:MAG TPA: glucose-1-phosphate thymidylyltransferase RfbA [Candidatus Megaira endosymbiont of Nemacystus decipiens]|nr:glucose-1-phosphate thymidylyltransferase RfbA [Candidatus Megaera endosymbiont of Nemacystus decipiens]